MGRVNRSELAGGIVLGLFGIFVTFKSFDYRLGTISEMGPGYFPLIVGLMICAIAAILLITGLLKETDPSLGKPDLKAMFWILSSLVAFAVLVRPFGIIPAVLVLILSSLAARADTTWRQSIVIASGLAALAHLLFIVGLGLNINAFRWGF